MYEEIELMTDGSSFQEEPCTNGSSKLDIGEFVITFRKIKKLTGPVTSLLQNVTFVTRWSSPVTSFICAVLCCWMCINFPAFLILVPLLYISLVLGINGIRKIGTKKRAKTWVRYENVMKKGEASKMELKQAAVNQAHEDLREFIDILIVIQLLSHKVCGHTENMYRLFKWDDPVQTVKCFAVFVAGLLVLWLIPGPYIAVLCVLTVFAANGEFKTVFSEIARTVLDSYVQPSVNQLYESWHWLRRRSSTALNFSGNAIEAVIDDDWVDAAENEMSSSGSASEGQEGCGFGESMPLKNRRHKRFTVDYKSMVSQLADYRRKKKTLKFGTCASCNMSFSGLLKKRQYCRHCGNSFCSRCCSQRVKRAVFGATAPAAYEETVLVCKSCYGLLMSTTGEETSEFW